MTKERYRYCMLIDLKNDPVSIQSYDAYHKEVWPDILAHHRGSGILEMDIYRAGNRLFMIMEVDKDFSFAEKAKRDRHSAVVKKWEVIMAQLQQALPFAEPGETWLLMDRVFALNPTQ